MYFETPIGWSDQGGSCEKTLKNGPVAMDNGERENEGICREGFGMGMGGRGVRTII